MLKDRAVFRGRNTHAVGRDDSRVCLVICFHLRGIPDRKLSERFIPGSLFPDGYGKATFLCICPLQRNCGCHFLIVVFCHCGLL